MPNNPPIPAKPAPPHTLVALRGRLGTGGQSPETWQMNARGLGFVSTPATETQTAAIVAACVAYVSQGQFTQAVHLDEVRISSQAANGHQTGDTTILAAPATGTESTSVAFQLTCVVSLIAAGRGKGHKGRWYPPPQALVPSNVDGLVNAGLIDGVAVAAQTFINSLNAAGLGVAIIGRTGSVGTANLVTEIRVGRVLDTQRRRRRSLLEQYEAKPITA